MPGTYGREVVEAVQSVERDRRHLEGLVSEVADADVLATDAGSVFLELDSHLWAAIRRRAER